MILKTGCFLETYFNITSPLLVVVVAKQVLDAAQVGGEEYEIMKDLIIPLGRVPQFSAQSGG